MQTGRFAWRWASQGVLGKVLTLDLESVQGAGIMHAMDADRD